MAWRERDFLPGYKHAPEATPSTSLAAPEEAPGPSAGLPAAGVCPVDTFQEAFWGTVVCPCGPRGVTSGLGVRCGRHGAIADAAEDAQQKSPAFGT